MSYGLSSEQFQFLNERLVEPLKKAGARVYLFGSRASGDYKKFSDIDLCYIETPNLPVNNLIISNILVAFEESHFPYKIDLVNHKHIAKSYLPGIEKVMVEL